jgi:hypothetical protein
MVNGKDPAQDWHFAIFHLPFAMQDAFFSILLADIRVQFGRQDAAARGAVRADCRRDIRGWIQRGMRAAARIVRRP